VRGPALVANIAIASLEREKQRYVLASGVVTHNSLDLSKIEAGKITFEIMRFSFTELATTLSQCEKPRAQAKGIQLLLNINPNVPPWLYGDPTRIRQVLTNLLSNGSPYIQHKYRRKVDCASWNLACSLFACFFALLCAPPFQRSNSRQRVT
jgi:K+-sensing histidine kinase KdpD